MAAKTLKLAGFGFLMGMVVGAFIFVAIGFANGGSLDRPGSTLYALTGSGAGALLAQMLISGVYGAIPMAGVMFYEIDSWGLLKQAVVHYATYTVAFLVIGISVGWVEPTLTGIALIAGIFLICHCIIWLIMYARYKAETKELNVLLQEKKQTTSNS
jgi:hypothetical protein